MVFLTQSKQALIGFIGLGNMGAHMARNLIKKGHELVVYDVNTQSVNELVKFGILKITNQNSTKILKKRCQSCSISSWFGL